MKPENHNYSNVIIIIPNIKNKEITVNITPGMKMETHEHIVKLVILRNRSVRESVLYQKIDRKSRHSFYLRTNCAFKNIY